jgi:hypothetical protein
MDFGHLPSLNERLAGPAPLCEARSQQQASNSCVPEFLMSPEAVNSLLVLSFGFSVAGLLASGYQLVMAEPPSFLILGDGARPKAVASVLFLVFAAPFIIMRNTLRGRRIERRNFLAAMISTVIAGFWSLMSGTVLVMALQALGLFQA